MSFSRQFYASLLTKIAKSLYSQYTVNEDDALYLIPEFRDGVKVKISDDLTSNINSLSNIIDVLRPSIDGLWSGSGKTDDDTYTQIQENTTRIKGFVSMIDADAYKDYVKTPYKVDKNETILLPLVDSKNTNIVRFDAQVIETVKNTKALTTDPRIEDLKKVWPKADASTWSIE
jgi:hypothetical protein